MRVDAILLKREPGVDDNLEEGLSCERPFNGGFVCEGPPKFKLEAMLPPLRPCAEIGTAPVTMKVIWVLLLPVMLNRSRPALKTSPLVEAVVKLDITACGKFRSTSIEAEKVH